MSCLSSFSALSLPERASLLCEAEPELSVIFSPKEMLKGLCGLGVGVGVWVWGH